VLFAVFRGYSVFLVPSMTFAAFDLLFPIVVAIHNFDEYRGYTDFVRSYPDWLAQATRVLICLSVSRDYQRSTLQRL